MDEYWQRQESDEPLYPDILWSVPETKALKKKLVILGGNAHSFQGVAKTYELALESGIGSVKVVLPKKLERLIGASLPNAVYLENNASGGMTKSSVGTMLEYEKWGDGVLISGELGNSSETTLFINNYIKQSGKPITISGDSLESFSENPEDVFDREDTLIVADFKQLQKAAPKLGLQVPLTSEMGLVKLVEIIHEVTKNREALVVAFYEGSVIVAMYGEVSTTHYKQRADWQREIATRASVFLLQHQAKPFQAVTSSIVQTIQL